MKAANRRRCRRVALAVGLTLLVLLAAISIDAAWLISRVERIDIASTEAATPGQTWVIIGSDSRADKPVGRDTYGSGGTAAGGERADIILVVQVGRDGSGAGGLSIPRDLVLARAGEQRAERIALALQDGGVDELVGSLCAGLGIPTDHLVRVTMRGFVEVVDALGGIDLDFDYPTRDSYTHLDVKAAGTVHMSGYQALQFVRSRHPEYQIDGQWREASTTQGNAARASNAAVAIKAVAGRARQSLANPVRLQRTALALTSGIKLDRGASLWSLGAVAQGLSGGFEVLPVETTGTYLATYPNAETYERLAEFGYVPGQCRVE
ncbi:MAG: LCP family protein [Bifidobacteriaceae bacterium]|nr:LCP family protein [Bifidobacteriaceae bacterium]